MYRVEGTAHESAGGALDLRKVLVLQQCLATVFFHAACSSSHAIPGDASGDIFERAFVRRDAQPASQQRG